MSGFTPGLLPQLPAFAGAPARSGPRGKLRARADAKLAVDLGQVPRDGLCAQRERPGDLFVCPPGAHQRDDPLLGLRQLSAAGRPAADAAKLAARLVRPQAGAELVEDAQRLLQCLARRPLLLPAALDGAKGKQGAPALEGLGRRPWAWSARSSAAWAPAR